MGEGPTKKVRLTRSNEEGLSEKVRWRRFIEKGSTEKVRRRRSVRLVLTLFFWSSKYDD